MINIIIKFLSTYTSFSLKVDILLLLLCKPELPDVMMGRIYDSTHKNPMAQGSLLAEGVGQSVRQLTHEVYTGTPGNEGWKYCSISVISIYGHSHFFSL